MVIKSLRLLNEPEATTANADFPLFPGDSGLVAARPTLIGLIGMADCRLWGTKIKAHSPDSIHGVIAGSSMGESDCGGGAKGERRPINIRPR